MLCWHEGAHAVAARALGCEFGGVTVEFRKRLWWSVLAFVVEEFEEGANRSDVEQICSRVREMVPPPGASREWAAIWFLHARDEVVIKLAGLVGEHLRYGHEFTRDAPGACDVVEARALAETLVVAPEAVEELLRYCQTEAEAVVRKHWSSVEAVAAALEQCSTLSAAEIEGYIAVGVAATRSHRRSGAARNGRDESTAHFRLPSHGGDDVGPRQRHEPRAEPLAPTLITNWSRFDRAAIRRRIFVEFPFSSI